jgi:hypothetical protein
VTVVGDRNGGRAFSGSALHDDVAAALAYSFEPVLLEDTADLLA